jgi:hypothetical protein
MARSVRTRAGVSGLFAIFFFSFVLAATASALNPANSNKPYSVVLCGSGQLGCTASNPAVISPGGTATNPSTLTVTFTNNNKLGSGIKLGSDNLSVPATPGGFSVVAASLPACPAVPSQQGAACFYLLDGNGNIAPSGGTTVGFRNLNLDAGASTGPITLSTTTPPPSATACTTTVPCTWSDDAKQSNDFSGTGNDLSADSTSAYGTVTAAAASCPRKQRCATTLGDGGTATDPPGSVNATISTSSGKTAVTQIQALDFGAPLDPTKCSGVVSVHYEYGVLSNGADNGSDRTITTSITTTPFSGYQQEFCLETGKSFTQKVISAGFATLAPAAPTIQPDGSAGYQGLLPDCGTSPLQPLQVDCSKNPGVSQRVVNADGTTTTVAVLPPGYDFRAGN